MTVRHFLVVAARKDKAIPEKVDMAYKGIVLAIVVVELGCAIEKTGGSPTYTRRHSQERSVQ